MWTDEPSPKPTSNQNSRLVFWDAHGLDNIYIYLENRKTINSNYYTKHFWSIWMIKSRIALHHKPIELLAKSNSHPQFRPNYNFLFADLNTMLNWKIFSTEKELIAKSEAYFAAKKNRTTKTVSKIWKIVRNRRKKPNC